MISGDGQRDDLLARLLEQLDEQLAHGTSTAEFDSSVVAGDAELAAELEANRQCLEMLARVRLEWSPFDAGDDTPLPEQSQFATDPASQSATVGRFRIIRELGSGGLGIVYLAFDPKLSRQVALKVPRPECLISSELRRRFLREAEAAARLTHPHLVAVYEAGEDGGVCYIASEFCPGPTLADWIRGSADAMPIDQATQWIKLLAEAVQHAHGRGVLHRDIKPSNVLLCHPEAGEHDVDVAQLEQQLTPKLTDFGMAKLLEREGDETRSGALVGTPAYMAPEQARGQVRDIDARADVYALGALLYELLTGRRVIEAQSDTDALRQVLFEEPAPLRKLRADIPRDLEAICLKCLARNADARYVTAQALAEDLARYLAGKPTEARPVNACARLWKWARRRPALAMLASVATLSALGLMATVTNYNARLRDEARRADEARDIAELKTEASRRLLYAADVRLAYESFKANDVVQTLAILGRQAPQPGEDDLREFAWYQLHALCNPDTVTLNGHKGDVFSVVYSPNGRTLATAGKDATVRLWDAADGHPLHVLRGHTDEVTCVSFSPDGTTLTSGSEDGTVRAWNAVSGEPLGTFAEHTDHVMAIAYSHDGKWLASGGRDMAVQVTDVASSKSVAIFDRGLEVIRGIAFTPSDDQLFAVDEAGRLTGWRTADWSQSARKKVPGGRFFAVAVSSDGGKIACAGRRTSIWPWTIEKDGLGWLPVHRTDHHEWIQSLAFSPVDERLASSGKDAIIQVHKLDEVNFHMTLKGHKARVWSVAWSPDGTRLASASGDSTARIWRLSGDGARRYPPVGSELYNPVFSPNGHKLYARSNAGDVYVWDTMTHTQLGEFRLGSDPKSLALSADGSLLGIRMNDGALSVHSSSSMEQLFALPPVECFHTPLAWTPSGHSVVTTTNETTVAVVDVDTKQIIRRFEHTAPVRYVCCTPKAAKLITTSETSLEIWDLSTGNHVKSLPGSFGEVAASNDGAVVAAATGGSNVTIFDMSQSYKASTLICVGLVGSLTFSPDSKTLAIGISNPAMISLWDVRTKQELLRLPCNNRNQHGIALSPDGTRLATAVRDREKEWCVLEWSIKPIQ